MFCFSRTSVAKVSIRPDVLKFRSLAQSDNWFSLRTTFQLGVFLGKRR